MNQSKALVQRGKRAAFFESERDKLDIVNTKTGKGLKTDPFIELHDAVCDFIKYE